MDKNQKFKYVEPIDYFPEELRRKYKTGEFEEQENEMKIKIDTTLERDIDLLILEEFISEPDFADVFLNAVGLKEKYTVEEAIHSKMDAELGESDIVFILNINGKRHALHIEDKIDAIAMPNQSGRYIERAKKDILSDEYDEYSVLIVAPEKYLEANEEAHKYANQVKYEQLQDYFKNKDDIRSKYKLALVERAITDQKNGYQYEANPGMVEFCKKMNDYHKEKYPSLPSGSIAWWRYYPTVMDDVTIVFKANKGFCDLQFGHTKKEELFPRVCDFLSERMNVVQAGKSASIRIEVTPIWYENKFEDKVKEVDEALDAIYELFQLSKIIARNESVN